MAVHPHHSAILSAIKSRSGVRQATRYLGNSHPRYPINAPALREIAKAWARENAGLSASDFVEVIHSLIHAPSCTEKMMAGLIMDYGTNEQISFDPEIFNAWLEQVEGWAEVDAICNGSYTIRTVSSNWKQWRKLLPVLSESKNISKHRASLVFLCSPIRYSDNPEMASLAFQNIDRLKHEKSVLITKAISWLLRSMIKNFKNNVHAYVNDNKLSLPAIAIRETLTALKTGKKTK